jgi:prepilin-type N-terminal cleavage/methylation domain-containing protein
MTRGFTLLEMTVAVSLSALLLAVGIPAARRSLDRMAVVGAREALVGMVVRARSEALARGGAAVVVDPVGGSVRVESGAAVLGSLDLGTAFGVELDVGTPLRPVRLTFDGLGIGRVASRTIVVRRGSTEAGMVVSSYGRVTRR